MFETNEFATPEKNPEVGQNTLFHCSKRFFSTRLSGESLKPLRDFRDSRGKLVEKKSRFSTPK